MADESGAPAPVAPQEAAPQQGNTEPQDNATAEQNVAAQGQQRGPDGKFASSKPAEQAKPRTARERLLDMVDEEGNVTLKLRGKPTKMPFERALREMETDFAGKQRWTEIDKRAKELEAREARLRDPNALAQVLQEAGHDPVKIADRWLAELIQHQQLEQQLTPEQRQLMQERAAIQQEAARLQQEREQWQRQQTDMQLKEAAQANEAILNEHVPKQFEALGLPKDSPAAIETFRTYLKTAVAAGNPISPETVRYAAENAREELQSIVHGLGKNLGGKALLDFIGKDMLNAIRKADLDEYEASRRAPIAVQTQAPAQQQSAPKNGASKYVDERALRAEMRRLGLV